MRNFQGLRIIFKDNCVGLYLVFAAIFVFAALGTFGQDANSSSNSATPSPSPTPIAVSAINSESDRTLSRIREIRGNIDDLRVPAAILPGLESIVAEIEQLRNAQAAVAVGRTNLEAITSREREWQSIKDRLSDWRTSLDERTRTLDDRIAEIRGLRERWNEVVSKLQVGPADAGNSNLAAANSAFAENVPPEVIARAEEIVAALDDLEKAAGEKRAEFLAVGVRISELESNVDAELSNAKRSRERELANIFSQDSRPFWEESWASAFSGAGGEIRQTLTKQVGDLSNYARRSPQRFVAHGVLLVVLIGVLFWTRRRIAPLVEDEPKLQRPAAFFQMPIAAGLVLSMIFIGVLYPQAPKLLTTLIGAAVIVPGILILRRIIESPLNYLLYGLLGLYIADRLREILQELPILARALFSLEMIAACVFLIWFYRSKRVEQSVEAASYSLFNTVRKFIPVAVGVLGVALGANLFGFASLSYLIGNGVLRSAYAALLLYTFVQILISGVAFLLRVWPFSLLSIVRNNRLRVRQAITRGLNWIAIFIWFVIVLGLFSIQDVIYQTIGDIVGYTINIGEISFAIGDILLFAVMIWIAVLVSRFVRFVLEEDVFPRMDLGTGVAYAISSVIHYLVLISAFLIAIAAVGFEISRFAIVAGAVGLGLGFGLQNIINNFVSGLILLFERPVKVGDMVQIGEHIGSLVRIGLRASVVRKVDGSDVIVPNSQLISEEVINWTMSDDKRRIDIPVGVAYGTDPTTVLKLLSEIPLSRDEVLKDPAPRALFLGLGDSSLDFELRFWTTDTDGWVGLRSDMVTEVYNRLTAANIEIPFPQQDLHLRTVSDAAARKLPLSGDSQKTDVQD